MNQNTETKNRVPSFLLIQKTTVKANHRANQKVNLVQGEFNAFVEFFLTFSEDEEKLKEHQKSMELQAKQKKKFHEWLKEQGASPLDLQSFNIWSHLQVENSPKFRRLLP